MPSLESRRDERADYQTKPPGGCKKTVDRSASPEDALDKEHQANVDHRACEDGDDQDHYYGSYHRGTPDQLNTRSHRVGSALLDSFQVEPGGWFGSSKESCRQGGKAKASGINDKRSYTTQFRHQDTPQARATDKANITHGVSQAHRPT